MDEPLARLGLIVTVGLVAVGVGLLLSRRPRPRPPRVDGMAPGVVLFASRGCDSCASAESAVRAAVGDDYRLVVWESDPDTFEHAGVSAVPLVAVVGDHGLEWWAEGSPSSARIRRAARRVSAG